MKVCQIEQAKQVKNFVRNNVARMEMLEGTGSKSSARGTPMYLYDKNGKYLGKHSHYSFVDGQLWCTEIRGKDIKPKAQEIVCVQRKEVWLHPETEEEADNLKKLTTEMTTTTTILDHVKDAFVTVRKVCRLMNPLEEVKPGDPNCIWPGTYRPVGEPRYITCVDEVINEGSISKVNEGIMSPEISGERPGALSPPWAIPGNTKSSPFKFWYRSGK